MIGNLTAGSLSGAFVPPVPVVTGGTLYTSGGYNYRVFTANGTLGVADATLNCDILCIAGGGSGGKYYPGGGGAGGLRSTVTATGGGGSDGLRGLNQYPGANASYTGGTTSASDFGTSGTASSDGLHDLATYDQLTTNGNALANNVVYKDIVNFVYALPQAYWTPNAKFVINPVMLSAIRGLVDDQKRPIYVDGLSRDDGIVGKLLGFDVVVNTYVNAPSKYSASPGTDNLYPMFLVILLEVILLLIV